MNRRKLITTLPLLLVACAQPQRIVLPSGTPTAELNDWLDEDADGGNRRVFAVLSINGVAVPNAARNVQRVGFGAGAGVFPYMLARPIQINETAVEVIGRHIVGAPIEEIARRARGTFQEIKGSLVLRPVAGVVYRVAGRLGPQGSSLWIEETETRRRVTEVIASKSSA